MKSKECYVCRTTYNLHEHHIFPGSNRNASEFFGLKIWLCAYHHEHDQNSPHVRPNQGFDLELKQMAQTYFERHIGCRDEFIKHFNRSYL